MQGFGVRVSLSESQCQGFGVSDLGVSSVRLSGFQGFACEVSGRTAGNRLGSSTKTIFGHSDGRNTKLFVIPTRESEASGIGPTDSRKETLRFVSGHAFRHAATIFLFDAPSGAASFNSNRHKQLPTDT